LARALLVLSGCATLGLTSCASLNGPRFPSDEQIRAANYGTAPAPDAFERAIREWATTNLKDPSSLQLREISEQSTKGWLRVCATRIRGYNDCLEWSFIFGHLVDAQLNAKNSYGGYTGYQPYTFIFRGNTIISSQSP
jgi:hypothetical protein